MHYRIKMFCFATSPDVLKQAYTEHIIEEYHYTYHPEHTNSKWYCMFYPRQAHAEEWLVEHGCVMVPHWADGEAVGPEVAAHFPKAAGVEHHHTGFKAAKNMASHLGLPTWKPSVY